MISLFYIFFNSSSIMMMLSYINSSFDLMLFIIFDECCPGVTLICRMNLGVEIVILINRYDSKAESIE